MMRETQCYGFGQDLTDFEMSTPVLAAILDFANFKVKALKLFLVSAIFRIQHTQINQERYEYQH